MADAREGRARQRHVRGLLGVALVALAAGCVAPRAPAVREGPPPATSGYVDAGGGVQLYYEAVGAGRDTIVAVHGGPAFGLHDLRPDLDWLANERVVIFYDQRGTGRSTLPPDTTRLTMADHVADLGALVRHFALSRPILVGHSWGAVVAVLHAGANPAVQRLLLLEPMAAHASIWDPAYTHQIGKRAAATERVTGPVPRDPASIAADPLAYCRAIQRVFLHSSVGADSLASRTRANWCDMPAAAALYAARYTGPVGRLSVHGADFRKEAAAVGMPVLVVAGSNDPLPWESAEELVRTLPDARLLLITGGGHWAHAELPSVFQPAAEDFLRGRWPSAATVPPSEPPPLLATRAAIGGRCMRRICASLTSIAMDGAMMRDSIWLGRASPEQVRQLQAEIAATDFARLRAVRPAGPPPFRGCQSAVDGPDLTYVFSRGPGRGAETIEGCATAIDFQAPLFALFAEIVDVPPWR